jgi:hypothetical protein
VTSRRYNSRRTRQGGFALLVVFLFAAVVAFTLYRQLPRVAFERARDKEQLLIDRGGQYKRAIEVFYATNKRYPATMEELEKTTDKRFLRRRYIDPMTGKDEWRLIHTNGSFLTDSLVQKPPAQNAGNGRPGVQANNAGPLGANSMNTVSAPFGSNTPAGTPVDPNAPQPVNAAVLRRPSDRTLPFGPGGQQPIDPDTLANNEPAPFDPNNLPPITLVQPNAAQQNQAPGQPQQRPGGLVVDPNQQQVQPGAVNVPGVNAANAAPGPFNPLGNAQVPGQNTSPQAALVSAFGQQSSNPDVQQQQILQQQSAQTGALPAFVQAQPNALGQAPGQGGFNPQPAFAPNPTGAATNPNLVSIGPNGQLVPFGSQNNNPQAITPAGRAGGVLPQPGAAANTNPALGLIEQQLRTPSGPAVPAGITPGAQNGIQPVANNLGSPGIAGVASKHEGPSIKSYRERTKYQEWEFVFDPQTSRTTQQGGQLNPGQGNQNPQNPLQPNQPAAQPSPGQPSPAQGMQNLFSLPNPGQTR